MKKKGIKLKWRELLVNKTIDLIIVVLGVTIAFQFNNLKQRSDQRALEKFYLESMIIDLNKDLEEYKDNLSVLELNHEVASAGIKEWEKPGKKFDSIGLGYIVVRVTSIKTFEGHRNTYSTILNENGLSIINDSELRNLIIDHYRLYTAIERFESSYLDHISKVQDHFSQHIDFNRPDQELMKGTTENIQAKNLISVSANQLQQGIWRYQGSIDAAIKLKKAIETIINE